MTAQLEISWDSRELAVWRGGKIDRALTRAMSKAGGDAIRKMKTVSGRNVRALKMMKANRVSKSLPIFFPANKDDLNKLIWRMDVSGRVVPLSEYPHTKQTKTTPVTVHVNTQGTRKEIPSAFVVLLKSGHKGIFRRAPGVGRLPIRELFTTKVSDVFEDGGFVPEVMQNTEGVFVSSFVRLFALELDKLKP